MRRRVGGEMDVSLPTYREAETVVCGVGRTRMAKLVDVAIASQVHHRLAIRDSGAAVAGFAVHRFRLCKEITSFNEVLINAVRLVLKCTACAQEKPALHCCRQDADQGCRGSHTHGSSEEAVEGLG